MAQPVAIDFYLGLGSRYSYLAASQLERIEATYGCRFVWKPIASGALMDRRGGNPFRGQPLSGQYDWGYREYDAKCWASFYGIPFREPVAFRVDPDTLALACLAANGQGALVPCCRLLFGLILLVGIGVFVFRDRIFRGENGEASPAPGAAAKSGPLSEAWAKLTSGDTAPPSDRMAFRVASIARILDEAFDSDLLKGVWAQGAVAGTGASPLAPASAVLQFGYP